MLKLLIIGNEDILVEALGRIAPSAASIAFAADAREAAEQQEASPPDMIVVAGPDADDDAALGELLADARERYGAVRVRIGPVGDDAAGAFEHRIAAAEASAVVDRLEQLVAEQGALGSSTDGLEPAPKTLEAQVEAQAQDLKSLERRVAEVALGATAGLSELIASMDGVQQALKLHTRMIEGVKAKLVSTLADGAQQDGGDSETAEVLRARLENQSQDLKSLQQRVNEMAVGTTGGLTELVEASDGVQQAIKLHARRIDRLEQRVETEVMSLHGTVLALREDLQALRRDLAAMAPPLPDGDFDPEIDLMLEMEADEDDEDEDSPHPGASLASERTSTEPR